MADEYIRKQEVIDLWNKYHATIAVDAIEYDRQLRQLPSADVVPMEILKAEIYKLKCQQDCKNHEYYTGYMSALSTVEGILAEMGEE